MFWRKSKDRTVTHRFFEVKLFGRACAMAVYPVSSDFYMYWRSRPQKSYELEPEDILDREDDMGREAMWDHLMANYDGELEAWDDEDEHDKDSPPPQPGISPNEHGWPLEPLLDLTAVETKGIKMRIQEMTGKHLDGIYRSNEFSHLEGGFTELIDLPDIRRRAKGQWPGKETVSRARKLVIERDARTPYTPVVAEKIWGEAVGLRAVIMCEGDLDVSKISFNTWMLDGDEVVSAVLYDGKQMPNYTSKETPGGDNGRTYYYLGNLIDDQPELQTVDWYDAAPHEYDLYVSPSWWEKSGLKGFWDFWLAPLFSSRFLFIGGAALGYYMYRNQDALLSFFQRLF